MRTVRNLCARLGATALPVVFLLTRPLPAAAYPAYRATTANTPSCYSCHSGFYNRGSLHSRHVGSTKMTNTCTLCHTSTGDIPKTYSSGTDAGHACNGCHLGPGLRLHHAAAGVPADANGLVCADCHDSDPSPPTPESTTPPYYWRDDVNLTYPCVVATAEGGEDYSGDGKGLDNDGDLLYDQSDPDCNPLPTRIRTWGYVKSVYR
jgi:hypothetical protein